MSSTEVADRLFPWYSFVIRAFGADRCMFESNFPVDKDSVSYRCLWNAFKLIARRMELSRSEKTSIFSGTAARVYRLEAPTFKGGPGETQPRQMSVQRVFHTARL